MLECHCILMHFNQYLQFFDQNLKISAETNFNNWIPANMQVLYNSGDANLFYLCDKMIKLDCGCQGK